MKELKPDDLVFITEEGEKLPFSSVTVSVEVLENSISNDELAEATAATLYYFINDLGRTEVRVHEFIDTLHKVIAGLGFGSTPPPYEIKKRKARKSREWIMKKFHVPKIQQVKWPTVTLRPFTTAPLESGFIFSNLFRHLWIS